ncbi:LysR family transcriptional regulator [Streptosporangium sp. CA-135522]|uniref:LysR family transcriptional regulator n=1 Tax=Streptosporangium sp. CA-135522 TaxID=3240072 RepID=UPI003D8CEAB8
METRLLRTLVELNRRGTMRAVAAATGYGTSAISQQLAALEREVGAALTERTGRTVRLTWAGRRLAEHAERILAAEAEARAALDTGTEPSGVLKIAAFAAAISADILPIARRLAVSHPGLLLEVQEREPAEVVELLADGQVDLGFGYDYSLVRRFQDDGGAVRLMCETPLMLAVPAAMRAPARITSPDDLRAFADAPWVVNSRGEDDGELVRRMCATAKVAHRADSLGLVLDIVAADFGVALVPIFAPPRDGVVFVPMPGLDVRRRMFALTRPGEQGRPAIALVSELVSAHVGVD